MTVCKALILLDDSFHLPWYTNPTARTFSRNVSQAKATGSSGRRRQNCTAGRTASVAVPLRSGGAGKGSIGDNTWTF